MPKFFKNNKIKYSGFTLVETLIVIFIIALLTVLFLPNYKNNAKQLALERSAHKLYQDMRRMQEMAIASEPCNLSSCTTTQGQVPLYGYGIRMETDSSDLDDLYYPGYRPDNTKYIIYAHNDPDVDNYFYNQPYDTIVETIPLEKGVIVYQINNGSNPHICVNVRPPTPTIGCMCGVCSTPFETIVKVTLALEDDLTKTKDIIINTKGLIYEEP
jgi:type II secretory pathway pseudopilin PulG